MAAEQQVSPDTAVLLMFQLPTGTAEVFGTEMARNQNYNLSPRMKLAVFTWHGCTVRVEGDPQVIYVSDEPPMVMYLNTHSE